MWSRTGNITKEETFRQLSDDKVYRPIPIDPTNTLCKTLNTIITNALTDGTINKRLADFLRPVNPRIPVIYTLPKVHKDLRHPPGWPIVSGTNSIFQALAQLLVSLLWPYAVNLLIKDTTDFLKRLEHSNINLTDCLLTTWDVSSLYTNIPTDAGIEVVHNAITSREKFKFTYNRTMSNH